MREQTACNLTVRLTWDVPAEQDDRQTYDCAQDEDMAITMGRHLTASAPGRRRLLSVETSPSGGRRDPWKLLDLS